MTADPARHQRRPRDQRRPVNSVRPGRASLGCYEERYGLTGRALAGVAASLLLVAVGFLWRLPMIFLPVGIVLLILTAQGAGVFDRARRTVAFRADRAGITLGAVPDKLTVRRGSPLFIPWADVESVVIYQARMRAYGRHVAVPCVGVQRRPAAAPLLWGNEQAPGCPVPRVPAWATRVINGWHLDRDRLAAVIAAAAPGVAIVDTGAGTGRPSAEPGAGH